MQLPIKVLKDKDQNPFIPFVTTSSVVENGTNRNLDDILHNLTVPVTNLNSLENTAVADMMTNMKDYKDSGFAIIYVNTDNTGLLLAFEKITTVDVLNKCWSFVSSFNADSKAYRINITGYYNADNSVFTVSSAAIEEIQAGVDLSGYYTKEESDKILNTRIPIFNLPVTDTGVNFTSGEPVENASAIINFLYSLGDYTGRAIVHNNYNPNGARFQDVLVCIGGANKQRTQYTFRGMYNNGSDRSITVYGITINVYGTWTNDVFTANRVIAIIPYDSIQPVSVKDYINDKLTDPVQGKVIKKYVDDNINNAINNAINALPKTQDLVDNGFAYDTGTTDTIEGTTTVTNISTTYGFALNDKGYYESTNKGKASSWALCKVTINAPVAFTLTIPYISSGENSYDYGIFGQLDTELANSVTDDGVTGSTKVKLNCKGQASTDVKQVSYDIPAGEHFIEIKYRKDSSGNQGNDSLQFKVDATFSIEYEVYVNKKLATTDMLNTLPTMPVYYISAYNVMGTDVDITDAETLAQVNEIINSNYGKDVLLCIKDKTYKGYYMFLVMFWNKPKTSYTNTYKTFSTISLIQTEDSHRALTVLPMKFTYNAVAGEDITVTHIKYDTLNGNKKNEYILLEKFYTRIPGYNSSKTQVLKNVNGTLKWVTEEVA